MKRQLQKYGCEVAVLEIKAKIHNLTTKYRKEKTLIGPSGGSPSTWGLFYKIHNILGSFKINNVEDLVEESIQDVDVSNPIEIEILEDYEDLSVDYSSNSFSSIPSTSASIKLPSASKSTPAAGKIKKETKYFQCELLKRFDKMEEKIDQQNAELKEMDKKSYDLDVKKTELMERFVKSSEEYKTAIINYLQN